MIEKIRVDGLNDFEQGVLDSLMVNLEAKRPRNLLRTLYYDGKSTVCAVGSMIPERYYQLGLLMGWPAKAVDMLARRCNLDTFVWADSAADLARREDVDVFVELIGGEDGPPSGRLAHDAAPHVRDRGGDPRQRYPEHDDDSGARGHQQRGQEIEPGQTHRLSGTSGVHPPG